MYGLLTKREVKMARYWPSSFFARGASRIIRQVFELAPHRGSHDYKNRILIPVRVFSKMSNKHPFLFGVSILGSLFYFIFLC